MLQLVGVRLQHLRGLPRGVVQGARVLSRHVVYRSQLSGLHEQSYGADVPQ